MRIGWGVALFCTTHPKVVRFAQAQFVLYLLRKASAEHIKDVVVSFVRALRADAALFQQIVRYVAADHLALGIVVHLNELAEPRAIVVARGLRIAECLENGIGVKYFLFDGPGRH